MRLDMVYAPSSINYNLYPPSYIPPSIQNNCKKSQFVTEKSQIVSVQGMVGGTEYGNTKFVWILGGI